jgi:two-component system sensor histidine kinase EvgS
MNDCLFKPISLTALEEHLAQVDPLPTRNVFTLQSLDAMTGGDPQLSRRLLEELLSSSRNDRVELMAMLVRQAAYQDLIEQAHKIKGAARIIQADNLAGQCETLEQACGQGENRHVIEAGIKAMEKSMLELERMLQMQLDVLDRL